MPLSEDQIVRYSRHILLRDVGGVGQERLLRLAVAVPVGPERSAEACALAYLAAAGVGRLVLTGDPEGPVTGEEAERGLAYAASDAGQPRLDALGRRLKALNPDVEVATSGEAPALEVPPPEPGESPADTLYRGAAAAALLVGRVARK